MFGISRLDRRSRPERIADQAWEHLVSAVHSTGDTVRHTARDTAHSARRTTSHLAGDASDRAGAVASEAWDRASRAYDALAGRRSGQSWTWFVGAGLAGAAIGWATAVAMGRARQQADETQGARDEAVEFVDVDRTTAPAVSRDTVSRDI